MRAKQKRLKEGERVTWTTHHTNRAQGRFSTVHEATVFAVCGGLVYVKFKNRRMKSLPLAQVRRVPAKEARK